MSDPFTWQAVLDSPFVQRLLRPARKPGRIDPVWANQIFSRYQRPMTPLPLVDYFAARQQQTAGLQPEAVPFVLAQPAVSQMNDRPTTQPRVTSSPIVIQAKKLSNPAQSIAQPVVPIAPPRELLSPIAPPIVIPVKVQSAPLPLVSPQNTAPEPLSSPAPTLTNPLDRSLVTPVSDPLATPNAPLVRIRRAGLSQKSMPKFSPIQGASMPPLPPPAVTGIPLTSRALAIPSATDSILSVMPLTVPALPIPVSIDPAPALVVATKSVRVPQENSRDRDRPLVQAGPKPSVPADRTALLQKLPLVTVRSTADRPDNPTLQRQAKFRINPLNSALPLVQVVSRDGAIDGSSPQTIRQPLVLSTPIAVSSSPPLQSPAGSAGKPGGTQSGSASPVLPVSTSRAATPIVSAQAVQPVSPESPPSQEPVDVAALAAQVERKLLRKLVIERERRGVKA